MSTAYRHQSVGTIERNHRVLNEYIRAYISENIQSWEEYLRYFTFCYNTSNNMALDGKYTPFELIFSRKSNLPPELLTGNVEPIYNVDNYVKEAKYRLQTAHEEASKILTKLKLRNKKIYDKNCKPLDLSINDLVLLQKQPYDKLKPIYDGPYTVKNIDGPNVIIESKNKEKTVHKERLRVINELNFIIYESRTKENMKT